MSQYPPPYPPSYSPNFFYPAPGPKPLAPARRASVMLFVMGGLFLLCGSCLGTLPWAMPMDQILAQSHMRMPEAPPGMSLRDFLRTIYTVLGVGGVGAGMAMVVLGIFVRRAAKWACTVSIVLCGGLLLLTVLNVIAGIIGSGGNPMVLVGAVVVGLPGVLLAITMVWLFQAVRIDGRALQHQYQMQMWQYQQQAQYGAGYPAPPVPTGGGWEAAGPGVTPPGSPAPANELPPPPPAGQ